MGLCCCAVDRQKLQEVMTELAAYCGNSSLSSSALSRPAPGAACCAQFSGEDTHSMCQKRSRHYLCRAPPLVSAKCIMVPDLRICLLSSAKAGWLLKRQVGNMVTMA